MTLVGGIILLGIVIGIARAYPKTSILIAFVLLICYVNSDAEPTPEKQTNISKSIESPSSSSRIQENPGNYYRPNTLENKNDFNYTPSIETSTKTKTNTTKIRIGAVCNDGTTSRATGRGACSHHGGVSYWLYE
ncbi:DUF3761 domain-containing protein [Arenibacter sp. N53]|uniref:DUF3761 domain-containing protein n=1 Tax=Arenibacter TaxID=178469 RepID=UPI000CD433CB|nr:MULTISPECIES: DUF3761 domain-containing protein [Arenibacter]MCM4150028.1 DUF3761 domain-containing protein [Arenibacter sp. N53]